MIALCDQCDNVRRGRRIKLVQGDFVPVGIAPRRRYVFICRICIERVARESRHERHKPVR